MQRATVWWRTRSAQKPTLLLASDASLQQPEPGIFEACCTLAHPTPLKDAIAATEGLCGMAVDRAAGACVCACSLGGVCTLGTVPAVPDPGKYQREVDAQDGHSMELWDGPSQTPEERVLFFCCCGASFTSMFARDMHVALQLDGCSHGLSPSLNPLQAANDNCCSRQPVLPRPYYHRLTHAMTRMQLTHAADSCAWT